MLMALSLLLFTFCQKQDSASRKLSDDPSVKHKITWIAGFWVNEPDPKGLIKAEIEKDLNIELDWQWVPNGPLKEKTRVLINAGDFPDCLTIPERWDFKVEYEQWAKNGVFLDLKPYIEKFGPNIKKYRTDKEYNEGPGMLDGQVSGKIYGLPTGTNSDLKNAWFIRKDWLDKFGLSVPETLDEWYTYWEKCTNEDPDGNGKKDTYGIAWSKNGPFMLEPLFQAFDVLPNYPVDVGNGEYRPYFFHPNFQECITFINKIWENGLMDLDSPGVPANKMRNKFVGGFLGTAYFGYSSLGWRQRTLRDAVPTGIVAFPEPPKNKDGKRTVVQGRSFKRCNVIFSKAAEVQGKAERIIKLWDWFLGDKGRMLSRYGIEGRHYTVENGQKTTTETWKGDNMNNIRILMVRNTPEDKQGPIEWEGENIQYTKTWMAMEEKLLKYMKLNPLLGAPKTEAQKTGLEFEEYEKEMLYKLGMGEVPITEKSIKEFRDTWLSKGGKQHCDELNQYIANQMKLLGINKL